MNISLSIKTHNENQYEKQYENLSEAIVSVEMEGGVWALPMAYQLTRSLHSLCIIDGSYEYLNEGPMNI